MKGVTYIRFMDDWALLTQNKRILRKVIKKTHEILNDLQLSIHPQKTYIGRISKGFNFLGFYFDHKVLLPSRETIRRSFEKSISLYEDAICFEDPTYVQKPLKSKYRRPKRDTSIYQADEKAPDFDFCNDLFEKLSITSSYSESLEVDMQRYLKKWSNWLKNGLGSCQNAFMHFVRIHLPQIYDIFNKPSHAISRHNDDLFFDI